MLINRINFGKTKRKNNVFHRIHLLSCNFSVSRLSNPFKGQFNPNKAKYLNFRSDRIHSGNTEVLKVEVFGKCGIECKEVISSFGMEWKLIVFFLALSKTFFIRKFFPAPSFFLLAGRRRSLMKTEWNKSFSLPVSLICTDTIYMDIIFPTFKGKKY